MKSFLPSFTAIVFTLSLGSGYGQNVPIAGETQVCVNQTETYTIQPINNYTYQWVVTNGVILFSSSDSCVVRWNQVGTGVLAVTALKNNQEIGYGEKDVTIEQSPFITSDASITCVNKTGPIEPAPNDSSSCIRVCEGSEVTFFANTNGTSSNDWSVVGGTIVEDDGTYIVVRWTILGTGFVSVKTSTQAGCDGESVRCVEVIESPEASFAIPPTLEPASDQSVCAGYEIHFKDLSTGSDDSPLISWQWDFGDGNFSTAQNPSHIYTATGSYTVELTVENACHCKSTYEIAITVNGEEPDIIECASVVCENQTDTYRYVSGGCSPPLAWEVNGGSILGSNSSESVEVKWDSVPPEGFGYVSFTCESNCEGTTTLKIPVILAEAEIKGPAQLCEKKATIYELPEWPATEFEWSVSGSASLFATDQPNEIAV